MRNNKIIFKTLMLKGEAGATIASMERTGHVGTTDIYTITFSDGTTAQIPLENMSAIISVEKTSQTDTQDIYTITCADGSTQTFSVLNHNTDIAGMESDIAEQTARIDNFLATQTGTINGTKRTETVLFESATPSRGTLIQQDKRYLEIEDEIDDYDYIEIYYGAFEKYNLIKINPSDVPEYIVPLTEDPVTWSEDSIPESSSSPNYRAEFEMYKYSGEPKLYFTFARWGIRTDANYYTYEDARLDESGIGILKIVGIKYTTAETSKDPELTDVRVGADGVTYASAGAAVRGQITAIKEDLNSKITNPSAGTQGQILTNDGQGGAVWSNVGTPTDAQVGEAVETWLDDHPEATTTVQDYSLTIDKMVKGTLGYVTPQLFGAKGDGTTDDTTAIQNAVNYAAEENIIVMFPSGTYMTTVIPVPQGITIIGQKGAVLKRPNLKEAPYNWSDTQIKFSSLMAITASEKCDVPTVIDGLTFDGNCWSMWEISDGYKYESASLIYCYGSEENGYCKLDIRNCNFYDNFASGVSIRSYADVRLTNCASRDQLKGLFTAVGHPMIVDADGLYFLDGQMPCGFHTEINFPTDRSTTNATSIHTNNVYSIDCASCPALGGGANGSLHVYENMMLLCDSGAIGAEYKGITIIRNSRFEMLSGYTVPYIVALEKGLVRFENCVFVGCNESGKALLRINPTSNNSKIEFVNCKFSNADCAVTGNGVQTTALTFDGCEFTDTIGLAVGTTSGYFYPYIVDFSNCVFANTGYIIDAHTINGVTPLIKFRKNRIENSLNTGIHTTGNAFTLDFGNDVWENGIGISQIRSVGTALYLGSRTIITKTDPAESNIKGIAGVDTLIYKYLSTDGNSIFVDSIYKWIGESWVLVSSNDRMAKLDYTYASLTDIWSLSGVNTLNGLFKKTDKNRILTNNFISSDINTITIANGYEYSLFAYTLPQTYVGEYNGETFARNNYYVWRTDPIDMAALRLAFPNYYFMLCVRKANDGNITIDEGKNVYFA